MKMDTRELVQTNARGWRSGVISMNAPHHGNCRKCGGRIWFGQVQFKGKEKPSWVLYSEAGHGGGGAMVMDYWWPTNCVLPYTAMSEKIDNTVDEWLAAWPSAGLSDRERKLVTRSLRDFYSWLRRIEDCARAKREPEPEPVCPRCGWEIDPNVCHCGELIKFHGPGGGHSPVPMGCTCGYDDAEHRKNPNRKSGPA